MSQFRVAVPLVCLQLLNAGCDVPQEPAAGRAESVRTDQDRAEVLRRDGYTALAGGNFDEAQRYFYDALGALGGESGDPDLWIPFGMISEVNGERERALSAYLACSTHVSACQERIDRMDTNPATRDELVAMGSNWLAGEGAQTAHGGSNADGSKSGGASVAAASVGSEDCAMALPAACETALQRAASYAEKFQSASGIQDSSTAAACIMAVARDANYACAKAFEAEGRPICAEQARSQAYQFDRAAKQSGVASAMSLDPASGAPTASDGRRLCDFEPATAATPTRIVEPEPTGPVEIPWIPPANTTVMVGSQGGGTYGGGVSNPVPSPPSGIPSATSQGAVD